MGTTVTDDYDWFFRDTYPAVVLAARMILQDRQGAEDVAQEAFVRLARHWAKVSKYDRPEAWVRRVAIRIAVKEVRKRRMLGALVPEGESRHVDEPYDIDLMNAIRQLPAMQRAAVVLFYLEDRPLLEIAHILDCSESTAGVHLHRGRRRLAHLLGDVPDTKEAEGVV
jgi:RNA polymerase sigma factor (sigma-70 family)